MANIIITNTSQFRPFTFDEMLKPVQMAQEKHEQMEDAYDALGLSASEFGSKLTGNDPQAQALYKAFTDELDRNAEELSRHGLQMDTRKNLMALRQAYGDKVMKIKGALEARKERQDEWRKMYDKDQSLLTQRDIITPGEASSVDRWLENENYGYGNMYSGNQITAMVAGQLAPIAKALTGLSGGRLDAYTNYLAQQHGLTIGEAMSAVQQLQQDPQGALNNPNSNPIVSSIVKQTLKSTGIPDWGNEQAMRQALNYAALGITSGIGETNISPYEDFGARENLKFAHSLALMNARGGGDNGDGTQKSLSRKDVQLSNGMIVRVEPITTASDMKKHQGYIDKYDKYFYIRQDGSIQMTPEGRKEYLTPVTKSVGTSSTGIPQTGNDRSDFRKFMDDVVGYKPVTKDKNGKFMLEPGRAGNAYAKYKRENPSTGYYDSYKAEQIRIPYNKESGKEVLDQIRMHNRDIYEVKFTMKDGKGKFEKIGKPIDPKSLVGGYVQDLFESEWGSTANIYDKDGNPYTIWVGPNHDVSHESEINQYFGDMAQWKGRMKQLNDVKAAMTKQIRTAYPQLTDAEIENYVDNQYAGDEKYISGNIQANIRGIGESANSIFTTNNKVDAKAEDIGYDYSDMDFVNWYNNND